VSNLARIWTAFIAIQMTGTFGVAHPSPQANTAQILDALTATERTFAKTASVKGWRAAFLEFFAEDAIALAPDPTSAIDLLKARPVRPFSEEELTWEPRAGDIAASGEMGWLTGPSIFIDRTAQNPSPQHGNYLSVWKKQKQGQWRVFIDVGTPVPAAVTFPTWFTHVTAVPRFKGKDPVSVSTASLLEADRQLNASLLTNAAAKEYLSAVVEHARLHRAGTVPPVSAGRDEIARWFAGNPATMTATTSAGEAAASGEIGYTYGRYEMSSPSPQRGAYLRVWSRQGDRRWRIAADVTAPVRDGS
jgi:ketosteroid isomerase-like protein